MPTIKSLVPQAFQDKPQDHNLDQISSERDRDVKYALGEIQEWGKKHGVASIKHDPNNHKFILSFKQGTHLKGSDIEDLLISIDADMYDVALSVVNNAFVVNIDSR